MSYTPVELRHVRVSRSLFGYNRAMVEQVIEEVAESFENAWRERGELTDQVDALEKQLAELRSRETLLTNTLVHAEQAAKDVREQAKREAEMMLAEAHHEARSIERSAQAERERLVGEARRIEGLLRAALGVIEAGSISDEAPKVEEAPAAETPADDWPREDTRELGPIPLPPAIPGLEPEADAVEPFLRKVVGGETRSFDWGD